VAFEVRDDSVAAQMRDPADVLELAWDLGLPRVLRRGHVVGAVRGVRVVLWHDTGAQPLPEGSPCPPPHNVWPGVGTTSLDGADEDTHDHRRHRRA
jgi:hypothetical protein